MNRNSSFDRANCTNVQSNVGKKKEEKHRVFKPSLGFNVAKTMQSEDSKVILVHPIGVEARTFSTNPVASAQGIDCGSSELLSVTCLSWYSGGKKEESLAIKLGFAGTQSPSNIYVGFTRCALFPFNALPLLCYYCQRLGYVSVNCNSPFCCLVCSGPHTKDECTAKPGQEKCANCHQTHVASSKECPAVPSATLDIRGNEAADRAAVLSNANNKTVWTSLCYDESIKQLYNSFSEYWRQNWFQLMESTGKGQFLAIHTDSPVRREHLCRWVDCAISRLRLGHVGVAAYLHRFQLLESPLCRCGQVETVKHFLLNCDNHSAQSHPLK
ncbi:hypothetical protein FHG87_020424 [Trinorchestia longiramus]|nr:hypothetical protein FHG87_020424 [Trinorchestia longiramus]